jgi:hypothetical protein
MNFDGAEKIAAAILYEGYILYPYRPTAIKNRQRWNFGTLYPRVYAEARRPQEPFRLVAECLAVADATASLDVRISFLQLVPTQNADKLVDPSLAWDEAVERTSEHVGLRFNELIASPLSLTLAMDAGVLEKFVPGEVRIPLKPTEGLNGAPSIFSSSGVGRQLRIELSIGAEMLSDGVCKLHLELQNTSPLPTGAGAKRDEALPLSFVSAHLLLGISGGEFVSLLDPDPAYQEAVAACCNTGVFPVLVGEEPDRPVPARRGSMMFCSPIILYDYPKIAPESEGDFFDGTEMDEMLTLRVLTLTDAEKQEMRNGDPRARKILERTEGLTSDALLKAHGVIRGLHVIRGGTP